jgi:quinol monooxygenase YgiN
LAPCKARCTTSVSTGSSNNASQVNPTTARQTGRIAVGGKAGTFAAGEAFSKGRGVMRTIDGVVAGLVISAAIIASAAVAPSWSQNPPTVAGDQASFVVTYIDVAPTGAAQAANLLKEAAAVSRKEPGNIRYEILRRIGDASTEFAILEVWGDAKAFQQHAAGAAMKQFRDRLKPLQVGYYDERPSLGMMLGPVTAAGGGGAVYVLTHVDIAGQNNRDPGNELLKLMSEGGRKEPGAERFEVWQQANRLNHFTVNEVWKDAAARDAHVLAPSTKVLRERLGPIIGALYDDRVYRAVE